MDIPLPSVIPDTQAGGGLVTAMGGMNALNNAIQQTKDNAATAQYAPYQAYGNAFLTNQEAQWTPYKYQMQALSNPLLWLAAQNNPAVQAQLTRMLQNSMPGMGGSNGMPNIPMPGQSNGNSLFNMLMNKLTGNQPDTQNNAMIQPNAISQPNAMMTMGTNQPGSAPTNAMNPPSGSAPTQSTSGATGTPNPLVPSSGGPMAGAAGKITHEYNESPYAPEALIPDPNNPGHFISKAGSPAVGAAQQAILGISNLKPILEDIGKGAERWGSTGEKGKVKVAQALGFLKQYFGNLNDIPDNIMKSLGVSSKDVSDYAGWQAQQEKAIETYMKARQWPQDSNAIDRVSDIIKPILGEGKEYTNRVTSELAQLENNVLPNYQNTISQGFNLPGNLNNTNAPANSSQAPSAPVKTENEKSTPTRAPEVNAKNDYWYIYDPQGNKVGVATSEQTKKFFKDYPGYYRKKN